jgi:hypothetical protein
VNGKLGLAAACATGQPTSEIMLNLLSAVGERMCTVDQLNASPPPFAKLMDVRFPPRREDPSLANTHHARGLAAPVTQTQMVL